MQVCVLLNTQNFSFGYGLSVTLSKHIGGKSVQGGGGRGGYGGPQTI